MNHTTYTTHVSPNGLIVNCNESCILGLPNNTIDQWCQNAVEFGLAKSVEQCKKQPPWEQPPQEQPLQEQTSKPVAKNSSLANTDLSENPYFLCIAKI